LRSQNPEAPAALVVVTSMRGLCGGYNANVLRLSQAKLEELRTGGRPSELRVFGKKGIAYFRYLKEAMADQNTSIGDAPRFEQVEPVVNGLIEAFLAGRVSAVHVAYMRFYSAGRQRPEVVQLLPLVQAAPAGGDEKPRQVNYEFRPDAETLLSELLPATVRVRLFQAFLDASVSEQIARMVAMKAATEASEEMIKTLSRQYNRARQTQITMELLDIVGGANALA
jgi:F-type H+-transporting ATPase subunit gamma